MMLTKLILSAVLLPFALKVPRRGSRAYEAARPPKSPALVAATDHPTTMDTQRKPVVPVPELRLVSDVADTRLTHSYDASDASERNDFKDARVLAFDRRRPASTGKFVRWLSENHGGADLSRTRLLALYFEFTELTDRLPLRERQLLNAIKKHGVVATRPTAVIVDGKQRRPTTYRVKALKRAA